jgi:two-component system sensor histidine kinase QseC
MTSIRVRLFAILLVTTGLVWLSAIGWIYVSTEAQVEKVLDARLREAARMVDSLIVDQRIDVASAVQAATRLDEGFQVDGKPYQHQLSCQIWSLSGGLVGQSESAPRQPLSSHQSGFQDTVVDGENWRVFAVANERLGVRVLVGDSLAVRRKLVDDVIKGLLLPAALILPILAGLIWVSVGRGLAPLRHLAAGLAQRSADDLHPVDTTGQPSELRPVSAALNGLFQRVADTRERERNFTAFAAHELKTPLAGLRTQAQVALASDDGNVRSQALGRIIQGVDRTGRLVRQLLDLSEVEGGRDSPPRRAMALSHVIADVVDGLAGQAQRKDVTIQQDANPERSTGSLQIDSGRDLLALALRNVLENAIQYAPPGSIVRMSAASDDANIAVTIADEGPGMSDDDMAHATERFFRAANADGPGSGLGLSIAGAAMEKMGGAIVLQHSDTTTAGLTVTLSFPSHV